MEVFKKIFRFLSTIVYVLILIYILVLAPRLFNYKENIVLDDNLSSVYSKYTIVYYYKTSMENIIPSDLITYKDGDKILAGRVHDISGNDIKIKNDNEEIKNIKYEDVLGRNSNIIIHIGKFILFVRNNTILSICIAALVIIIDITLSICTKKIRKKKILEYEE